MNGQQTYQQPKSNINKAAVASLILGIGSISLGILFGLVGAGLPAFLGLILGVIELRSAKRNIAIIGIYWILFITSTF